MEMNQMKRKVLSLAMIAALCLTMLPTAGWAADAPVEYIDFDENGVQITEPRSCDQYSLVTENNTEWNASDENNGWYVVSGEVTIGKKEAPQRVTVSGDVHLILANDAKLTVNGGISVNAGNSLTVYAQPAENDKTTGSLTVENVEEGNAGIGGDVQQSGDTITINGGEITATGGTSGSGIGGGSKINGSGGTITINGGEITANGGDNGAGIGGGSASSGGIITINGGTIATTGGNLGTITGSGAIRLYGTLTGKGTIESVQQVHPVRNLSLSETNLNMTVGDEPATLTATVEPTDATNPTVTWSSSNDNVVTVADGKVTAVAAGFATITAISADDPDITATCEVTVKEASDPDPGTDPEEPGTDPDPEPGTDPDDPSTEPDDPAEDEPSDTPSTPVIPSEPDPEIEVTEPAHGDVEISPSKPEAGETVTITLTPDAGWEVEDVIVTDEDGEGVPVTENPDGSWSYEQPESDVTIEVIFGEVAPEPTVDVSEIFLDVDPDAWYKDAVQFAYDNGLMTGTSATEFAPDVTTTRAMIVSILARLEGVTAADDAGFSDVDDEWFATAVNWAANVGVVNGFEDNTFRPNDAITREQLAAILCNYAAWKGEDVSARAELSRYSDAAARELGNGCHGLGRCGKSDPRRHHGRTAATGRSDARAGGGDFAEIPQQMINF